MQRTHADAREQEFDIPIEVRPEMEITIEKMFPMVIHLLAGISRRIIQNEDRNIKKELVQLDVIADFFVSYYYTRRMPEYDNYLLVLSAASYYFLGKVGNSVVLADIITESVFEYSEYAELVVQLLRNKKLSIGNCNAIWADELTEYVEKHNSYFLSVESVDRKLAIALRDKVLQFGSDRDIFCADIFLALSICKTDNLSYRLLKNYTSLSEQDIIKMVSSGKLISEMWPSQKKMAEMGFLSGKSGVIQLPTGAGKTKAIALCIYSYLCNDNPECSVVVTPFRALCREVSRDLYKSLSFDSRVEIVEVSDLIQDDCYGDIFSQNKKKKVIVVTPEKLLFLLSEYPEFAVNIGQIIFDEGHLFEDKSRGAKFELLISTILINTMPETQKVLVSAMIGGLDKLNKWITDGRGSALSDNTLQSGEKRIVALEDYESKNGTYYKFNYFRDKDLKFDYFVPSIFKKMKMGEATFFPMDDGDYPIAVFFRLVKMDNCAMFCSAKKVVEKKIKRIVELACMNQEIIDCFSRNDGNEKERIRFLIEKTYGKEHILEQGAQLGVFAHHAGVTDGIKSSIEYALQKKYVTNVICTSTLAQGVNMPIKYMILHNLLQGETKMSTKDFFNLIGRVGRPGMYLEGTIIFSDINAYKKKKGSWNDFTRAMSDSTDKCYSNLGALCRVENKNYNISNVSIPGYICSYYASDKKNADEILEQFIEFDRLDNTRNGEWKKEWEYVLDVLGSIEWFISKYELDERTIDLIAQNTLAWNIISESEQEILKTIISEVGKYIGRTFKSKEDRVLFSKSMMDSDQYSNLVNEAQNIDINDDSSHEELLEVVIPILQKYEKKKKLSKLDISVAVELGKYWIRGISYLKILEIFQEKGYTILKRTKQGDITVDEIVDICNTCFGYNSTLIMNVLSSQIRIKNDKLADSIDLLGSKLKYGLPTKERIYLYEMGFNDRNIVSELSDDILGSVESKEEVRLRVKENRDVIKKILEKYPSYYTEVLSRID